MCVSQITCQGEKKKNEKIGTEKTCVINWKMIFQFGSESGPGALGPIKESVLC